MEHLTWKQSNHSHYAYIDQKCVALVREPDGHNQEYLTTIKGMGENVHYKSLDRAIAFVERAFNPKEDLE